jgi:acetoin utilization protein AcuA
MPQRQTKPMETPKGPVELITYVTPRELECWTLDEGIGHFSSYRSLLTSRESLTNVAKNPDTNLCIALSGDDNVVGFCVRRPPQLGERWAGMNPPIMHEVLGENARGWRDIKLMKPMLELVVSEEANDDRILYIVGYSWHWDLDYTKKDVHAYRDTIIHLLQPLDFRQYPTNEPNISLRPENLFMARIGKNLDKLVKKRFTNLLFGITED